MSLLTFCVLIWDCYLYSDIVFNRVCHPMKIYKFHIMSLVRYHKLTFSIIEKVKDCTIPGKPPTQRPTLRPLQSSKERQSRIN